MTQPSKHDTDFYTWTQEQAALLRSGRLSDIDLINLAEEVEDMGISEKRALESRLEVLIMHLLKWKYQPERRKTSHSWRKTITEQRARIQKNLKENPGLKPLLKLQTEESKEFFLERYRFAKMSAETETGLESFPKECPFTLDQILDDEFYPGD